MSEERISNPHRHTAVTLLQCCNALTLAILQFCTAALLHCRSSAEATVTQPTHPDTRRPRVTQAAAGLCRSCRSCPIGKARCRALLFQLTQSCIARFAPLSGDCIIAALQHCTFSFSHRNQLSHCKPSINSAVIARQFYYKALREWHRFEHLCLISRSLNISFRSPHIV